MTKTERMRRYRQRKRGDLPPVMRGQSDADQIKSLREENRQLRQTIRQHEQESASKA
ncbi:hypothetical protein [Rhizobium gallicum]|uniref:hypothetical protein n=1 Tax=Rhizobium gallicum TaxID=56730 RepID=UPI001EF84276|nr:hypothetical protein [Rhizobium gallicum]ULJ70631.1 hypothetical protein L2W42_11735 [Rhizobium gallicum]